MMNLYSNHVFAISRITKVRYDGHIPKLTDLNCAGLKNAFSLVVKSLRQDALKFYPKFGNIFIICLPPVVLYLSKCITMAILSKANCFVCTGPRSHVWTSRSANSPW